MRYNIQELKKEIIDMLIDYRFRYELVDFPSGCSMIDFCHNKRNYVIQLKPESIGFSLVEEMDLGTVPDERFYNANRFSKKLKEILTH